MIEVTNLSKKYGAVTAVNSINFSAQPGQVTGFLGPNGAGKTTTMRMLTGYMPPTSGNALVAGFDVFENSMDVRRRVGYLPETVPLYRDMTALSYLMFLAEVRGLDKRKQRALDSLEQVRLTERASSSIRTLSKGMRQRVGLAAALIHDPEVLILDEPTIGLDPRQVLELRELVAELGRDHTVLFSTHILSEAEQVCDSVVIINQGAIVQQGSPTELRAMLERGQRILVRVEDKIEEALETVSKLDIVAEAMLERDALIIVPVDDDSDERPAIARALVNAGFNISELRPAANSLEEIFLELTRRSSDESSEPTESQIEANEVSV